MNETPRVSPPDRLFDVFERTDSSPARHRESSFAALNRRDSALCERVRNELDSWFAAYPEAERRNLRARFRKADPEQHGPALAELYLFRLFKCLGYEIEVHPSLPGIPANPDFRLSRPGEPDFYLEAVSPYSGIVEEGRHAAREGYVLDIINEIQSQLFFVSIEFQRVGQQTPSKLKIQNPIRAWLEGLDPDEVIAQFDATGEPPALPIEIDDWEFTLEAFGVKPEYRHEPPGRLIGAGPMSGGAVDDVVKIRAALQRKVDDFKQMTEPLVLAVVSRSTFAGDRDFASALYGSVALQYTQERPPQARWIYRPDGIWYGPNGPRARTVSAALTVAQLGATTLTSQLPRLWPNPWANQPLEAELPLPKAILAEDDTVKYIEGPQPADEIFGLPVGWPQAASD